MLVTLPADLAELAGCSVVDVREDDIGFPEVYDGKRRLTCFSLVDLSRIQALANTEPMRAPEPGRPLKRGEKPRERRSYGEPFSARRTGRYAAMMHRGTR